jgi:hypothetical protein
VSFLFPTLLWIGLPLAAVPILIHLINLRRQRRIPWAAMQFLLESQRRHKKWILLKQLLLLLMRVAAIVVLVLMLAHLVVRNEWLRLLGSGTTHHVVLVDDSYSMSDRWETTDALAEGKRAVQSIVDQAYAHRDTQLVTLLRFSEAAQLSAGAQPQIYAQQVDDAFRSRLETLLASWDASQTDVGPADALKAVQRLPLASDEQTLIVYLVTDFRARHFEPGTEIQKLLSELREDVAQIHLVRCVRESRPNLAITSLAPESGVRAAGVEMWMTVTVANFGDTPARGVTVQLEQDGDALPALALEDIPPREEVTHKFRVQFSGEGAHWLSASLAADAVDVDNRRYFASWFPAARPVLVIDGSRDGRGARQLSLALDPGGNTRSGWSPHVEPASFLLQPDRLAEQAAVFLLDVPRLGDEELANLEKYVADGGGLAVFVGTESDRRYYNERLYRGGAGLFPVPLKLPTQLPNDGLDASPDVVVTDHPLFRVLAGRRNSFVPLLMVDYYYAVEDGWTPPSDGSTQVIARLRNREPLVVEKRFGEGRVVAQLTKLSSGDTQLGRWTNWSLNPVFPVLANELVNYLSAGQSQDELFNVGENLTVAVAEGDYEPTFRFLIPADGGADGPTTKAELPVEATPADGRLSATLEQVATSGVYEVQLQTRDGGTERRAFAFNVPVGEGDLQLTYPPELSRQLAGVAYQLHDASEMAIDDQQLAGWQMGEALLATLVLLLLGEQLLAYVFSYHIPPARETTA